MFILFPLAVAAVYLFTGCSREESSSDAAKPRRLEPEDLIIGPEPVSTSPHESLKPQGEMGLSEEGKRMKQDFRRDLEEMGVLRGLSPQEQYRVGQSFQANSLHVFFESMLSLGNYFETEGRSDIAKKIYQSLLLPQFPIVKEVRDEAQTRLSHTVTIPSSNTSKVK